MVEHRDITRDASALTHQKCNAGAKIYPARHPSVAGEAISPLRSAQVVLWDPVSVLSISTLFFGEYA